MSVAIRSKHSKVTALFGVVMIVAGFCVAGRFGIPLPFIFGPFAIVVVALMVIRERSPALRHDVPTLDQGTRRECSIHRGDFD